MARETASASLTPIPVVGFLGGVFASQVVNNALHLAQPLLIAELSGSLGHAAFFSAFDTAVHMSGTALGGWPCDRIGARRLLIVSTGLRGVSLALIPALWAAHLLTLNLAMAAYTLDAFVRGFTDTAVHTLPLELAAHEKAELDRLNARYEFVFDMGAVLGPALLAWIMVARQGAAPHVFVAAGFLLAAAIFILIPKRTRAAQARGENNASGGTVQGVRAIFADPKLLFAASGLALLNLFPIRKLLSSFFAKSVLGNKAFAGWIGSAFGVGGAAGSLLYAWSKRRGARGSAWVAAGAVGVLILAFGWVPGTLVPMLAAAFAFAIANVGARLAMTTRVQARTPLGAMGGVTAVARFAANVVSVLLKTAVGAAFAVGGGPRGAFTAIAGGLIVVAVGQFALAASMGDEPVVSA